MLTPKEQREGTAEQDADVDGGGGLRCTSSLTEDPLGSGITASVPEESDAQARSAAQSTATGPMPSGDRRRDGAPVVRV